MPLQEGVTQPIEGGYSLLSPTLVQGYRKRNETIDSTPNILGDGERLHGLPKEMSGWDVYNNESKKVDMELVNDWRESLNSLLLFAAIFAAVLTAFIIESKKMLERNPSDIMVEVMIFYTDSLANGTHARYTPGDFTVEPSAVTVNCLFFASLSISLIAALASVVALQWVADYDAAITRGGSSPEDRAKRRQFRYAGVVSWKMSEIIAALPLLLYCSVVLFYGGLILWMYLLHYAVGVVVAGGATIAILFYGISTFLSVAFVSAPFRTPLSRWIYSLIHLFFTCLLHLTRIIRTPFLSVWIEQIHHTRTLSRRREDEEVDRRSEMGIKALVWVANQLSVSQDSYHRLLLVVSELPKLKEEHLLSFEFLEAPWNSILDLIGWHNLKSDYDQEISTEETQTISILAQCYRLPAIYDIVRPTESMQYITDPKEDDYWSQFCNKSKRHWSPRSQSTVPNSMFLLFRDVPLPTRYTSTELELTIRLSRWRNSAQNVIKTEIEVPNYAMRLSSSSLNSSFVIVQHFFKEGTVPPWLSNNGADLFFMLVERMLSLSVSDNREVSPEFLDLLRRRFESIILEEDVMDEPYCLSTPIRYTEAFYRSNYGLHRLQPLHRLFTVLLARNLKHFSGSEKVRRVKEVITMLWARHGGWNPGVVHQSYGMEPFFDANRSLMMKWIHQIHGIPHIYEILHHLAVAQEEQPEIGPLWRVSTPHIGSNPHLLEVCKMFDHYIREGTTPREHLTIITLLCQDLELGPPAIFKDYFTNSRQDLLASLTDPCFQFLASFAAGIDPPSSLFTENMHPCKNSKIRIAKHVMRHSVSNPQYILKQQASVWPMISGDESGRCAAALRDPVALTHLKRIFAHRVPCPHHHDGEGHLLLHLFEWVPSTNVSFDTSSQTSVPITGRSMNTLLMMLLAPSGSNQLTIEALLGSFDKHCLFQVLKWLEALKESQFGLLSVLSDLCVRILVPDEEQGRIPCSEELAAVSICVKRALDCPGDERVIPIIPVLVRRMRQLEERILTRRLRSIRENNAASAEAASSILSLRSHLATMKVFGSKNSRALSCVRTHGAYSPARGWLPPYIE